MYLNTAPNRTTHNSKLKTIIFYSCNFESKSDPFLQIEIKSENLQDGCGVSVTNNGVNKSLFSSSKKYKSRPKKVKEEQEPFANRRTTRNSLAAETSQLCETEDVDSYTDDVPNSDGHSDPDFEVEEKARPERQNVKRKKDKDATDQEDQPKPKKNAKEKLLKAKSDCPHCPKKFGSFKSMRQHILRHESTDKTKKFFCLQCMDDSTSFETFEELKAHKVEFHTDKIYTCPKCDKVFKGNYYHRFKKHVAEHEIADQHVCVCCGFQAKSHTSLVQHKLNYGPYHDGKCPICQEEFSNWPLYERHVSSEHQTDGSFIFKCGFCPKFFDTIQRQRLHRKEEHFSKGDLSNDNPKRNSALLEKEQVCEFCGKLVRSRYYEKHLINNHGSGDYPCPQCSKVLNHPEVLDRHIKNFHNAFPCEQCGKTVRNRKKYRIHILSFHTPDHLKPYQCEICVPPKGFHTKTNLREHMNVHSNEKPHKCKFCGIGFNSNGNKYAHERSNHLGVKRKK